MRKWFSLIVLMICCAIVLTACAPVLATLPAPVADALTAFVAFMAPLGPSLLALLFLLVLDVVFGVLASLKATDPADQFSWQRLGEFYKTKLIPLVGGWFVLALMAEGTAQADATVAALGEYAPLIGAGAAGVAWLAVIGELGASVFGNVKKLFPFLALKQ